MTALSILAEELRLNAVECRFVVAMLSATPLATRAEMAMVPVPALEKAVEPELDDEERQQPSAPAIHDMRGTAIGQIRGTHVHKLSGPYVGELYKDMVVNRHLGNYGNVGHCGNPGNAGSPGNPGNRGSINYGYPDVFAELTR